MMPSIDSAEPRRPFRGWWVVAAGFAATFLGFGSAYSFSSFFVPLQQAFDASRGSVSLVFSLAGFLYFALGILSGPLADRFGARVWVAAGMLLVGAGMALASVARSLTEVYLAYGLGVGLGVGLSYVPVVALVQKWFLRRRAFASGLAVSGIGVGTLVMPPLAALLIEAFGWRGAYLALGVFVAIVGVAAALLIVNDPRDLGTGPDGDLLSPAQAAATERPGTRLREALATGQFMALYAACLIGAFGTFVPFVHLVPYAIDHGVSPAAATVLLGMIGLGSTVGRFGLGGVADRIGRRTVLWATFAGMGASLVVWLLSTSMPGLIAFAFVYGVFYGGWVAVLPTVVMDLFGARSISGIIGALYSSVAVGTLLGPSAAGFVFDLSGSYTGPIVACIGANFAGAIIIAATSGRAGAAAARGVS